MFNTLSIKILCLCAILFITTACATKQDHKSIKLGWTHECTLLCTNNSTGQQEKVQRIGKNADFSAVCKETKLTCKAGRSAACTNTADWTSDNEPLYSDCSAVDLGKCTRRCGHN